MGIDRETTAERLQIINENLSFIRSTLPSTPNQLADNQLKLRAVKEALLVTIQASIDRYRKPSHCGKEFTKTGWIRRNL